MKYKHLSEHSESKVLDRSNFCFKNVSKNKTPQNLLKLEFLLGVLFLLPLLNKRLNLSKVISNKIWDRHPHRKAYFESSFAKYYSIVHIYSMTE